MKPENDGIDHINVYSKGKTELGRNLSNFAHTPTVTEHGHFESLEGYWYWLISSKDAEADELRDVSGWEAKELGRLLKIADWPDPKKFPDFEKDFKDAMVEKLLQHDNIAKALQASTLPLKHYYVYNGTVVKVKHGKWILDFWEVLRKELKTNERI